ncbi:LOW QUALITY PROTEIN: hypothetical protein M8C21_004471 [Ambrosia artemisiifolia]|uniref:Uncharacterized protein n=1 Tax=Ambrosia artemisiifolia TaxID=4212 RepID=A0AAD5GM85_AMBAR|nr:LOW QUALITY PROTEIN: hypothetical protein M8C21_004471 [Ambrosia artemisiifolia]
MSATTTFSPSCSFKPHITNHKPFFGKPTLTNQTSPILKPLKHKKRHVFKVVNEKVVGIDLGTTNSAVAAMEGGQPTIITNAEGQRTTPSVVAYSKNGDRLVGQIAKRQAVVNPENTFFSVKRFIGRKMMEVDEESKQVSYKVVRDDKGNVKLECPAIGKQFAPEEISAQVLRKLVDDASKRVLPTRIDVYAVLEVGDGVFEVLSTSGDTHLGGDDFDKRIVDWLAENFKRDEGIDLLKDKQALQRLTETAEKAKMELSTLTQTNISLPFITATSDGPKHIDTTLTRAKFEELCSDLLDRLKTPVETALKDANLSLKDIDEVVLVGGSTRIPAVQELVVKMTGKEPNVTVNPDEVVALGASVQAGVLSGDVSNIVLLDVTPLSLGLETLGVLEVGDGVFEVLSTSGDTHLGGDDFDKTLSIIVERIVDWLAENFKRDEGIDLLKDKQALQRLTETAEKAKMELSTLTQTNIRYQCAFGFVIVERMVAEAEKYAKEDKEKREAIDTKNQAESAVYQCEKQLKEVGEKVPSEVKEKVEAKLKELKDAISGGSTQTMKDALAALNQEMMQLGQSIYSQAGGAAAAADGGETGGAGKASGATDDGDDEVIDADFSDSK